MIFPLSEHQMDQLEVTYELEVGRPLSREHLLEVSNAVQAREKLGMPRELSAADEVRAKELIADQQKNPYPHKEAEAVKNEIKGVESALDKTPRQLVKDLEADNGTLCKHLFGTERVPDEIQTKINDWKAKRIKIEELDDFLTDRLETRLKDRNDYLKEA